MNFITPLIVSKSDGIMLSARPPHFAPVEIFLASFAIVFLPLRFGVNSNIFDAVITNASAKTPFICNNHVSAL